jgi:hypothetical protein
LSSFSILNASAGFLVDPYVTFLNKIEVDDAAGSEQSGSTFGTRLACNGALCCLGVDILKKT